MRDVLIVIDSEAIESAEIIGMWFDMLKGGACMDTQVRIKVISGFNSDKILGMVSDYRNLREKIQETVLSDTFCLSEISDECPIAISRHIHRAVKNKLIETVWGDSKIEHIADLIECLREDLAEVSDNTRIIGVGDSTSGLDIALAVLKNEIPHPVEWGYLKLAYGEDEDVFATSGVFPPSILDYQVEIQSPLPLFEVKMLNLAAASAIVDLIEGNASGVPVLKKDEGCMHFEMRNLQSAGAKKALLRLHTLCKLYSGMINNGIIDKMLDKLRLNHALLKSHPHFEILSRLVLNSTYLRINDLNINDEIRKMNKIKALPKGVPIDASAKKAIELLKEATDNIIMAFDNQFCQNPGYMKPEVHHAEDRRKCRKFRQNGIGMFLAFDEAFSYENTENLGSKRIRDACMDFWETLGKRNVAVHELKLPEEWIKRVAPILKLFGWGSEYLDSSCHYLWENNGIWATSSPLTGFAGTIDTDKDESRLRELSDRNEEFQEKIVAYLQMFPKKFSKQFREYVYRQTKNNLTSLRSRSKSVIIKLMTENKTLYLD